MNAPNRLFSHGRYLAAAAIIVILIVAFLWIVLGPGPMHFASGRAVRMADYHGPDPTGVPANIAQASLIERGAYLTHDARRRSADGLIVMPAFGAAYSDAAIAAVSNYATARFGVKASAISAAEISKLRSER
jgi:hypothetical protein